VQVTGRIARSFHQSAIGGFPALMEAWLSTPAGDLLCVVFPAEAGPKVGESVNFTGTFLKSIRYAGGDQARLAPLIVGNRPPEPVRAEPPVGPSVSGPGSTPEGPAQSKSGSSFAWAAGLLAAFIAAGLLAWHHLRPRAAMMRRRWSGPPGDECSTAVDPSLEFVVPEHGDGSTLS
jgi:hypothetical protein